MPLLADNCTLRGGLVDLEQKLQLIMTWLARVGWGLTAPMFIALLAQVSIVSAVLMIMVGLIACAGFLVVAMIEGLEYI